MGGVMGLWRVCGKDRGDRGDRYEEQGNWGVMNRDDRRE